MLALQKTRPGPGVALQPLPDTPPTPAPDEVLVRVAATGVCGTDLHIDAWTSSYHFMERSLPVTLGHEFSGHVAALGQGVQGLAEGQLVTVRPSVTCGCCAACQAGDPDACTVRQGIGVARDGAFAPWVRVPARNCVPVPAGVDPAVASMAEPLTVSWESVRCAEVKPGDRVLVLGPGNIGQGIALFARLAGAAQVVVAGRGDAPRMEVLRRMGFADLVDVGDQPLADALASFLAQGKFDAVIEATGAAAVIGQGLALLKPRGIFVVTGIHAAPVPVDMTALVRNHHTLRGSYRAPESAWPEVVAYMQANGDTLAHMVTHRLPLDRALEGFALAHDRQATKVVVQP